MTMGLKPKANSLSKGTVDPNCSNNLMLKAKLTNHKTYRNNGEKFSRESFLVFTKIIKSLNHAKTWIMEAMTVIT